MLEGTDAKVHFIHYTPEMEEARSNGEVRTNSFVRLRRINTEGRPIIDVQDLGDAIALLKNRSLLREKARALVKEGIIPAQEEGWGVGWRAIRLLTQAQPLKLSCRSKSPWPDRSNEIGSVREGGNRTPDLARNQLPAVSPAIRIPLGRPED
jgi:hypothetical protein